MRADFTEPRFLDSCFQLLLGDAAQQGWITDHSLVDSTIQAGILDHKPKDFHVRQLGLDILPSLKKGDS
jgi:hypothetical protein